MKIKKMITNWKHRLKIQNVAMEIASELLQAENHSRIAEAKLKTIQDLIDFQARTADMFKKLEAKSGIKSA